jgi:hypothetical protein
MQSPLRATWLFSTTARERQIESWHQARGAFSWWRRVARWRAANPPLRTVQLAVVSALVMAGIFIAIRVPLGGVPAPQSTRGMLSFLVCMTLLVTLGQAAMPWRMRMLTLPIELTRPYRRRELQNEWTAAFVMDLLPLALAAAAALAVCVNLDLALRVDWRTAVIDFAILAPVSLAVTLAVAGVMVVVKRDWLAVVLVMLVLFVNMMAVGWLTIFSFDTPRQMRETVTPRMVESWLWVPTVVCAALAWLMWRRFQRMEAGSRS